MGTTDAAAVLARSLTERQLSDNIVNLARMLGYLVHRDPTWRSTGTDPGYPDLTLVRNGQVLFIELKSENGKLSADQDQWAACIDGAQKGDYGHEMCPWYYVWRPSHWYAGEIEAVLR